jgi:hypothetical protein
MFEHMPDRGGRYLLRRAERVRDSNSNADHYSYGYTDIYGNELADDNTHSHPNSYADSNANGDADSDPNHYTDADTY